MDDSIKELIFKILYLLHREGCIRIIRVNSGIIVKDVDYNNVLLCIGKNLLNEEVYKITDGSDPNSTVFPYSKDKILEVLKDILFKNLRKSKVIQKEYFLLTQSIEDVLYNENKENKRVKSLNSSIKLPKLNGKIVHQFHEENKIILLIKDFKPTDKIYYEIPMVTNLQKLWRGKTLHKNFAIIEVTQHGYNILCEFDAIGVLDDILCIFEIKNKKSKEISRFLFHFFKYSSYILEWLKKNRYKINYVAPILYFRENTNYKNIKINIIYYKDILENNEIKINILYQNFDGKIYESGKIYKDVIITDLDVNKMKNNKENNLEGYYIIRIPKKYYVKIEDIVNNSYLFGSEEEFIKFAFENAFNVVDLLKNKNS